MLADIQAVLASTIYESEKAREEELGRVSLGSATLDAALGGGLDYGRVNCLSGEPSTGKTVICVAAVVGHLLLDDGHTAAVIDGLGKFDVVQLYEALKRRTTPSSVTENDLGFETQSKPAVSTPDAELLMDKVKITRAFDLVGMIEVFNELKDDAHKPKTPPPATHVEDSEDEGGETLLDWPASPQTRPPQAHTPTSSRSLIVFLGFGQIVNALFKKDYVQGHAIISSFLRSLSLFANETGACIILTNPAYSSKMAPPVESGSNASMAASSNATKGASTMDFPSVFASNQLRSSIAKAIAPFVDLHLLLSLLPRTKQDAQVVYGTSSRSVGRSGMANVIEVMIDRSGYRTGRWAAFQIKADRSIASIS